MMRTPWTGCGTALVTPFTRDGAVDEAGVRRLARRQIDAGIHFLVPCGTTGESPTLTEDERVRVVSSSSRKPRAASRCWPARAATTRGRSSIPRKRMKQAGAEGILSVTPYYNKPTPEGLFQHYSAIAGEVGLPIIVYNVPGRTGCNVDVATLVRLSGVPGIVGVKEASGNITPDGRGLRRRARGLSRAVGRRCADAAADGGGRARADFGGGQRSARRDGAHGGTGRAERFRRRAADPRRSCCR